MEKGRRDGKVEQNHETREKKEEEEEKEVRKQEQEQVEVEEGGPAGCWQGEGVCMAFYFVFFL